ncbi:MAG: cell division ATP-binding protein FtsE [Candidatus Sericytochromatia bacterium]|nr:cell division ATP-binding protein FtsE [Candidatus Tanganyikabacteria bacterium]
MIRLKQVSKIYPSGVRAVTGANLDVEKGEFVFLVGLSGAGKSTLLKLMYRAETATSGSVLVSGTDIGRLSRGQLPVLRRRIGVVFQDYKLLPQRTVFENVAFALKVLGTSRSEVDKRTRSALDLVNLREYSDLMPGQLSGGQQQRVCLARAIVNTPPLLLCDEPTGNLDPDTSWDIMRLLTRINQHGTTVLVATHNKHIVDSMRRRVVALDGGRIVQDIARGGYPVGVG